MSAEYYYGDVSYVSAGYYEKTVRNWISSNTVDRSSADIFGGDRHIPHPAQETSALYAEAVAAIGGDPDATAIRNWLAENRADNALVQIQTVDGATQDEAVITSYTFMVTRIMTRISPGVSLSQPIAETRSKPLMVLNSPGT